ncbi:MAG: gfo/Idh/MocA family oxidoreductase, partial [Bacteroidota bacterium]
GEDFAWVQFEFESGMPGFLDANRYNENTAEDPRLTFGSVTLEGNKGTLRLYDDGRIGLQLLGQVEETHHYDFQKKNFAGDCVFATQKHFVDALISEKPFETNVADYLNNLKVQKAIYDSHENNKIVRL